MIHPNFVYLGVAIQFFGGFRYFFDTLKGKVQPNKVTWLLWSISPLVAFAAEVSQGVGLRSLTTFIVGFTPLTIFIASFFNKKAHWQLRIFDIVCGILSIMGLLLWHFTKIGNIAIVFAILADGLAAIPTIRKTYTYPESEEAFVYIAGNINMLIGLAVIRTWNFEQWAFPVYILLVNFILIFLIYSKIGKYRMI